MWLIICVFEKSLSVVWKEQGIMTQLESSTYFCGVFPFYYLITLVLLVHNFKVLVNSHSSQQ